MTKDLILCPKCGSKNNYISKKGYSTKKGIAGMLLIGKIGLLAGTIGSNKIEITCLNCGHKFKTSDVNILEQRILNQIKSSGIDTNIKTQIITETINEKTKAPPKTNQKLTCNNCNSTNDLGIKYCRCCGHKIDYSSVSIIRNGQSFEYIKCPECENKTPKPSKRNKFCVNCGTDIRNDK